MGRKHVPLRSQPWRPEKRWLRGGTREDGAVAGSLRQREVRAVPQHPLQHRMTSVTAAKDHEKGRPGVPLAKQMTITDDFGKTPVESNGNGNCTVATPLTQTCV